MSDKSMTVNVVEGETRSIDVRMTVAAPVADVWHALTDAQALMNWFPLEARVKPGVGGSIWSSWRGHYEAEMPIEIWEPEKHLRLVWHPHPEAQAKKAQVDAKGEPRPAVPVAVDYFLAGKGGETVLRLVHSGFGRGASWDEQFDGTRRGWNCELRGLRHYLEHHRGTKREVAWARVAFALPMGEAWARIMGREGLDCAGALRAPCSGQSYALTSAAGDSFSGTISVIEPPLDFVGTVDRLNNALLHVRLEPTGCSLAGTPEASIWLSAYGVGASAVRAFEDRYTALLRGLLSGD